MTLGVRERTLKTEFSGLNDRYRAPDVVVFCLFETDPAGVLKGETEKSYSSIYAS